MPIYHQLGQVPRNRHSLFPKAEGGMYAEELVGDADASSLLYHIHEPTRVRSTRPAVELRWKKQDPRPLQLRHFRTHRLAAADRVPLLFNADVAVLTWTPHKSGFYRNAQADEVLYVAEGAGTVESQMGELAYKAGDYVMIPRGIIHRLRMDPMRHRFLILESRGAVRIPQQFRGANGQLNSEAPFTERNIRRPRALPVHDEVGEFSVVVKKDNWLHEVILDHHPFDVVGWDGYFYPWAIGVQDGARFEADGFVVRSLGARPEETHYRARARSEQAVYHLAGGTDVEVGSLTLHPEGLTHAAVKTEWAIQLTSAQALEIAEASLGVEDGGE